MTVLYNVGMDPNPVLRKLGFSDRDRLVIIHADDIGMCGASVAALPDLFEAGVVTSGAVMTPCPWFPAAARFAADHRGADLGVHVTLTSEWAGYRWGPVSTVDPSSGLLDAQGYLHATAEAAQANARPQAVAREIDAQIGRAERAGMTPSHADTHMGAVAHPAFMESYLSTALAHRLPPMVLRMDEAGWRALGGRHGGVHLDDGAIRRIVAITRGLEEQGIPLLDHIGGMSLGSDPATRLADAKAALRALEPGVTHFIIHPALDTPELRSLTPDWACRAADARTFATGDLASFLREEGIHPVGYRALQALMR